VIAAFRTGEMTPPAPMSTMPAADMAPRVAAVKSLQSPEVVLAGLYERHSSRIFGFCRKRLRTPQEAEDALQNTFIAAMQALRRGTVPVCEAAWLFKIAENACTAIYRAGARRNDRELTDPQTLSGFAGPGGGADALVGLAAALDTITENQRKAFVLRELRGLSYAEIAAQLGVSVASVETLIYRARRGLARALEGGAGLRGRLTAALDLGSIAAAAKAWLGGLSAVKIGLATAVIAAASVPARDVLAHNASSPTRIPIPSVTQKPTGDPDRAGASAVSQPRPWSAQPHSRPRPVGGELANGRRPAPSGDDEAGKARPMLPAVPSPQPPPAAAHAPGAGAEPSSPRVAPPPPATSPPSPLPPLPAKPVEIPRLAEPLPEAPPVPQAPSLLPDAPAVPDPAPTLPQLPQLP
jgi:DNA-directed RNA polymerase specialized sigma24 family protein